MGEALEPSALERWQRDPAQFISDVLVDPETKRPFELLPAERRFLAEAFKTTDDGRLMYPEQVYSAPKKSGKTALASMHLLTTTLVYGGAFGEGYAVANDLEQAQGRVYQAARRIVEASPYLRREATVTDRVIKFPATGASIIAIASDYAGAAGANPSCSTFDELWGYTSERSRRLWDEMVPPPTRKIAARFTSTYAGFSGESELLEEIYKRGLAEPSIGPDLHAGDGLLMFWTHSPVAPWQDESWLAQMRKQLRPNAYLRLIENRFVTTESSFIDLDWWDACVDPDLSPVISDRSLPVWIGIDASVKRDSTAIVVVTMKDGKVRLVWHRIFQPSPTDPLDFESTIEATVKDLHARFRVRAARYDPFQMQSTAQRLTRAGVKMEEFPQSVPNLTEASQNLYELIKGRNLSAYPDEANRLAVSRAVAVETPRGWRIAKEKQSHKIDFVVALGMAAHAAIQTPKYGSYDSTMSWVSNSDQPTDWATWNRRMFILNGGHWSRTF